jgi:hypothetical protein
VKNHNARLALVATTAISVTSVKSALFNPYLTNSGQNTVLSRHLFLDFILSII